MTYTWVEPFAGAAAVALRLVGGGGMMPPVSWMGGKRRLARAIALAMGVPVRERPARVLLADAGPWGWVWPALLAPCSLCEPGEEGDCICVPGILRRWQGEHPRTLWERLAAEPPREDLAERCAQWLWLQARSASGVPVWWSGWRWSQADHSTGRSTRIGQTSGARWEQASGEARPPQPMGQRGLWQASDGRGVPREAGQRAGPGRWEQQGGPKKSGRGTARASMAGARVPARAGGIINPSTIAERIEAIREAFSRVGLEVFHGDARALPPAVDGPTFCYLDPPYEGATGYGWDCPREEVVALARRWSGAGAVVAVSEAEELGVDGWSAVELTRPGGKPEWLTISREAAVSPACQLELFGGES